MTNLLPELVEKARAFLAADAAVARGSIDRKGQAKARSKGNAFLKILWASGYAYRVAQEIDAEAKQSEAEKLAERAQDRVIRSWRCPHCGADLSKMVVSWHYGGCPSYPERGEINESGGTCPECRESVAIVGGMPAKSKAYPSKRSRIGVDVVPGTKEPTLRHDEQFAPVDAGERVIQAGKWHEAGEVELPDTAMGTSVQRCRKCGRTIARGPAWFYPGDLVRVLSGTCMVERV